MTKTTNQLIEEKTDTIMRHCEGYGKPAREFIEKALTQVATHKEQEVAEREKQYWIDMFDSKPIRSKENPDDNTVRRICRLEIERQDKLLQSLTTKEK